MSQTHLQAASSRIECVLEQHRLLTAVGAAVLFALVVYRSLFKKPAKLPLPYYYVESDVVSTIEGAHKDVGSERASLRDVC